MGLTVSAFRPQRRWQLDHLGPEGYAHSLPEKEQHWLERFNREYYGADNELLRPETHQKRCAACRHQKACRRCQQGRCASALAEPCEKVPPPRPLHRTREARRSLYVAQNAAGRDVLSMGRADFIDDIEEDPTGERSTAGRLYSRSGALSGSHAQQRVRRKYQSRKTSASRNHRRNP